MRFSRSQNMYFVGVFFNVLVNKIVSETNSLVQRVRSSLNALHICPYATLSK